MSFDRWRSLVDGAEIDVGAAIPDSVVAQHSPDTFETNDGQWDDDFGGDPFVVEEGSFESDVFADNSPSIFGTETDAMSRNWPIGGSDLQSWAIEFEIQYSSDNIDNGNQVVGSDDDDQEFFVNADVDEGFNDDQGNIRITVDDNAGNRIRMAPSTNPGLNDGERHAVSISYLDTTVPDVKVIIDGNDQALSFDTKNSLDSFVNFDSGLGMWAIDRTGRGEGFRTPFEGHIGKTRIHDEGIEDQTI